MDLDGRQSQKSSAVDCLNSRFSAISQTDKQEAQKVVAASLLENAREYEQEARRIKALVDAVGVSSDSVSLDHEVYMDLAALADILDLNQVDTSSYLVALTESELSEFQLDDRQAAWSQERHKLEGSIQKSVRRRVALEKLLKQLKEGEGKQQTDVQNWSTELEALREHGQFEETGSEDKLRDVGFSPEISHNAILKLGHEKGTLEVHLRPVSERLKKFCDLPPDVERAEILVQQKEEEVQEWKLQFDKRLTERMP